MQKKGWFALSYKTIPDSCETEFFQLKYRYPDGHYLNKILLYNDIITNLRKINIDGLWGVRGRMEDWNNGKLLNFQIIKFSNFLECFDRHYPFLELIPGHDRLVLYFCLVGIYGIH